jgi:hypothetical protein
VSSADIIGIDPGVDAVSDRVYKVRFDRIAIC